MCEYISTTIITENVNIEKYVYDKNNGLWYDLQGDYYIPCLTLPAEEAKSIGIWGQRHLRYIKQERRALYTELLTIGRLNTYLADINEEAEEQMLLLTKQIAEHEGVTEQLKAQDQMLWVQRVNSIRDRATEIIKSGTDLYITNPAAGQSPPHSI